MILNNAVNAGNFVYCMAYFGPHETNVYHNIGNGHYHQFIYIVEGRGSGTITSTPNGEVLRYEDGDSQGQLIDLTPTKGMYHTTKTKEQSLSTITFNPIPDTRELDVSIVKGPVTKTVTALDKRITIVCITGPINANDKSLKSLQHAKIFPNKSVELVMPDNTVCTLVSDK